MRYLYLTNEAKDEQGRSESMWRGYKDGDPLAIAYRGEVLDSPYKIANEVLYEQFNVAHPKDYRGRSMSVGDVILYPYANLAYAVASAGFKEIAVPTKEQIDGLGWVRTAGRG